MTNETSVAPATEPPTLPADAPLVDRLAATASARAAVISRGRKASSARRYDRGGWASLIFRVRHRGFEDIWPPLLLVLLVSAAWTPLVATGTVSDGVCDAIDTYQSAFSLLMTVLSLLLAFRLNRAAHRHYEARGLCGLMIAKSREVSIGAIAHFSADPKTRDALCEIAVAYPVAFHVHLTGGGGARPKSELRAMLEGIVDEATLGMLLDASHWPNTLTLIAQQRLDAALSAARGTDRAVVAVMFGEEILDSIRAVAVALGGCERIMGTPLPFVYVSHLRTFLVLVLCFGVPLVFACSWGWAAIGLAPLVAFCFLGVEAASIECERPFSGTPSKNHHDLERFAIAVSAEVEEMLRCAQRASKYAF